MSRLPSKVMLEPASEQLVRPKFLFNPAPELAACSKALLGRASEQLMHSKIPLKPAREVAGLSKMLPARASDSLSGKVAAQVCFSAGTMLKSARAFGNARRDHFSKSLFEVTGLCMTGLSYT